MTTLVIPTTRSDFARPDVCHRYASTGEHAAAGDASAAERASERGSSGAGR